MRTLLCATALALLAALPAAAQSDVETPSDRYTRDRPPSNAAQSNVDRPDQQAQSRDRRHRGEIETLRRDNMSAPNVRGQAVPEDTETGAAAPEQRGNVKRTEGAIRP